MHDRVGEVLAQRAALGRGATAGVVLSVLFHAALATIAVYAATHATPSQNAPMVQIQFAPMPTMTPATPAKITQPNPVLPKTTAPRIAEPQPKIAEPKPVIEKPAPKPPEKNTVPLSPFGRSTKKGSEAPAVPPPPRPAASPSTTTATAPASDAVPIGGSGVTGLEGGDFPYTLYVQGMQRKIGGNWFRPQIAGGAAVVVYYRIQRDGTITDAKVETSSGNGTFDRAALSAVRSASPLNPLPFAYSGSFLGVHLAFR